MDHQSKQKSLKTLTQVTKSLFLKHITHLLLSVSLLSLLVTNFSRLSFLCSFNSKFSKFPIQLFTHTLDKNYTFLICNGILVFVAKISSSRKSSQSNNNPTLESYKYYDHHDHETIILESTVTLEKEEVEDNKVQENVDVEKGRQDNELYATTQEYRHIQVEEQYFIQANEEQGQEHEREHKHEHEQEREMDEEDVEQGEVIELDEWSPIQEDEEEDDDEGNGVASAEELNKRFDEFIKKMKEGLRIEAQQQYLVMVN